MSKLKKRMAGEKLDERFGEGFTDRVKSEGIQEPTKQGASKRELLAEFRTRPDDVSVDDMVTRYQGIADSGQRFNRQAREYLKGHGVTFNKPKDIEIADEPVAADIDMSEIEAPISEDDSIIESSPIQTITNNPAPYMPSGGEDEFGIDQTLNINQDNDIYNRITGNNNNTFSYQNNAITNSGIGGFTDNLYAKRDPEGFKNLFMNKFFS